MIPTPNEIAVIIGTAIKAKSDSTPRTVQSREGLIGPSDLGFCRQKAALMAKGVQQSDSKSAWAANVGTAIHEWVEDAIRVSFPTWKIEHRFEATFPCGAVVGGNADLAVTEWNAILDIKTVDGFEKIKRYGPSQNHKFQRHAYALGAIQAGVLDDTLPVYVGNVYLDRSGREAEPYVVYDEFDPMLTDEINAWIEDVIYATQHQEDASRDVTATVCERICEFYSVCRGTLPERDPVFITDEDVKQSIRLYVEGRDLENQGKRMKDEAKGALLGISGADGEYQVRWTHVEGGEVPGFFRASSDRLDIRRMKRQ